MGNYSQLKAQLQSNVYQNSSNAVTGGVMQNTLMEFINTLGTGSGFMGFLASGNKPTASVDGKQFYIGINSGATAVSVDLTAVGLGTVSITRDTMWLVWSDGTGWNKQDIAAGLDAVIPHNVTDMADHANYDMVETVEEYSGTVAITALEENKAYVCKLCTALAVTGYDYDVDDITDCIALKETHIIVEAATNFSVTIPTTALLRTGDSRSLVSGHTYMITVKGYMWKIEQYA